MELKILQEKDTPLLARKRVTIEGVFEGATPSRKEMIQAVASATKTKPEHVVIRHIYTKFGRPKAKILCHLYERKEDLDRLEEEYLKNKHREKKAEENKEGVSAESTVNEQSAEKAKDKK